VATIGVVGESPDRKSSIGMWVIGISGIPVTRCLCNSESRNAKPRSVGDSCQHIRVEGRTTVEANCQYSGESGFESRESRGRRYCGIEIPVAPMGDKTAIMGIVVM
jgi:hypothetical protein